MRTKSAIADLYASTADFFVTEVLDPFPYIQWNTTLIHSAWDNSLDSQVNVLLDAEANVATVGEVLLPQLILLHLEASLQDLLCLFEIVCQNDGKPFLTIVQF